MLLNWHLNNKNIKLIQSNKLSAHKLGISTKFCCGIQCRTEKKTNSKEKKNTVNDKKILYRYKINIDIYKS